MKRQCFLSQAGVLWLLIAECLLPAGSGEMLNDTLEGLHAVDGDPMTVGAGSGDGSFLDVTEGKVSE